MSEAPERIMAYGEINTKWGVQFKCQPMPMQGNPSFPLTEYVRADRIEELEAKLAAERERIATWLENTEAGYTTKGGALLPRSENSSGFHAGTIYAAAIRNGDTP